jgi:hypothetical protein
LISGDELSELKFHTWLMAEAFGLDERIDNYQGKRPIGLYRWDLDCLINAIESALADPMEYPEKNAPGYSALRSLLQRLQDEYRKNYD